MPPSESARTLPAESSAESRVVDGLRHLYTAFQKSSIYAPGHPAAVEAIRRSTEGLSTSVNEDDSLLISVGRGFLLLDGGPLRDESGALQSLASLLHDLDVSALRIDTGVGMDELDGLVQTLGQARREGLQGGALSEMLERLEVHRVRIVPTVPGTGDGSDDAVDPEDDVWESLEAMLTSTEAPEEDAALDVVAEKVHQELARNEGTGVGEFRERIKDVSREIDSIKPDRRTRARQRLSRFVAALNPKLRQDLLRFDGHMGDDSLSLMTELGDVVPETDLLEALQSIDRAGARVPEQLLTLLSKLMRVSKTRPTLASGLQDTMNKWGVTDTALHDETELRTALEEVFRRRDRVDCNPIPHQELLDTLARYEFDAPASLSLARYRDPEDLEDVRRQTAEIATRIVALPGGGEHRPGLFQFLQASTDELIDAGLFNQVRDGAVAARTYSLLKTNEEQTYRAAQSYLNDFDDDGRVRRILGSACSLDTFPEAAINLLELCGSRAVQPAMAALIETESPTAVDALQRYLAGRNPEQLRPELAARLEKGWSSWQKIFAVLRRMPPESAVGLADPLLNHDEFEVRREALMLLHDLGGDRERRLAELRRALTDDSSRFARVAVRCLSEMDGDEPVAMLGDYIDGTLGVTPLFDAGVRATQTLLRLKEPGVQRLCRASRRLRKSFDPRRVALARKIVELLGTEDDSNARSCVSSWRFSPAWWISLIVPRPEGADMRGAP